MKTILFELRSPDIERGAFGPVDEVYKVPTLPAYAIVSNGLDYQPGFGQQGRFEHEITGDKVRIKSVPEWLPTETRRAVLTVHFAGIRDHSLLFPSVERVDFKSRLGEFAEEAEAAFANGSWMSFTVMAISAIEGLLHDAFEKKTKTWEKRKEKHGGLELLIDYATDKGALEGYEGALLHDARRVRNRIHAGRFSEPLADRASATDMYVLYERLLKKDWNQIKSGYSVT